MLKLLPTLSLLLLLALAVSGDDQIQDQMQEDQIQDQIQDQMQDHVHDTCLEDESLTECAARAAEELGEDLADVFIQALRDSIEGPCEKYAARPRLRDACIAKEIAKWKRRIDNIMTYPVEFLFYIFQF